MTVFTIPSISKKDAAQRKERGTFIEALFADFGLGNGKIFSTDIAQSTMTFIDGNGVKVVFIISGIMDNGILTIATKFDKTTMSVGKSLDYEKFRATLLDMYAAEQKIAAKEKADKEAIADMLKRFAPYARQITLTASKFGFKVEMYEKPTTCDIFLTVDAVRKAVLKFDYNLHFKSVSIFNDAAPIEGFDYAYYEAKTADMKNIEALTDEIGKQLLSPAIDTHSLIAENV